jgi:hypothetical protein
MNPRTDWMVPIFWIARKPRLDCPAAQNGRCGVRLYRPAVGLVYKKIKSSDIQIAFIVDDARNEGLEHAFAICGGPKKMGFVRSIDEPSTLAELRRYLGPAVRYLLPDPEALDKRRLAVSLERIKHQACSGPDASSSTSFSCAASGALIPL